jgi:hypothetical protein
MKSGHRTTRKKRRTARDDTTDVLTWLGSAYLRDRVHAVFDPFVTALLDAALGVRHLCVKDATTQTWARVTDPDTITALLNRPALSAEDPVWIIHTQDPDGQLLDALLAFQLGAPVDRDGVPNVLRTLVLQEATGELTSLSHPELLERLRQRGVLVPHEGRADDPRPGSTRRRDVH